MNEITKITNVKLDDDDDIFNCGQKLRKLWCKETSEYYQLILLYMQDCSYNDLVCMLIDLLWLYTAHAAACQIVNFHHDTNNLLFPSCVHNQLATTYNKHHAYPTTHPSYRSAAELQEHLSLRVNKFMRLTRNKEKLYMNRFVTL